MVSKVVSGMGGAPSGLLKSGTNIASKTGDAWVIYGGPRTGLDPSIIFYAPLLNDLVDQISGVAGTYTRASADAVWLDSAGEYQLAAINIPRFDYAPDQSYLGLLMEPPATNKCEAYNAAPDAGLTNLTKTGDAASVLSRELATAALSAAGLSTVCPSGYVIRLDNSAGAASAAVDVSGDTGNTNGHCISAWVRKISGAGQTDIRLSDGSVIGAFTNVAFEQIDAAGTPGVTTAKFRMNVAAGAVAELILNQLEEWPFPTSPIITVGASATRAMDELNWSTAPAGFDDSEGTVGVEIAMPTYFVTASVRGVVTLINPSRGMISQANGAPQVFSHSDGTTESFRAPAGGDLSKYEHAKLFSRWASNKSLGVYDGTWAWTDSAYDGSWGAVTVNILRQTLVPYCISNVRFWNRDVGKPEIEQTFSF